MALYFFWLEIIYVFIQRDRRRTWSNIQATKHDNSRTTLTDNRFWVCEQMPAAHPRHVLITSTIHSTLQGYEFKMCLEK